VAGLHPDSLEALQPSPNQQLDWRRKRKRGRKLRNEEYKEDLEESEQSHFLSLTLIL